MRFIFISSMLLLIFLTCASNESSAIDAAVSPEKILVAQLDSDGVGGKSAQSLIEAVFGAGCIESPEYYSNNYPGFKHIQEDSDALVGNHFVFYIHRDIDRDRDKYPEIADRQRNEIKIYDGSRDNLKGKKGNTFLYTWRFKIAADMPVTTKFSHFFQLKAVGGDDSHPVVTFTGAKKSGTDVFEIRYSPAEEDTILASASWSKARGQWLYAEVQAAFSDAGSLEIAIYNSDGTKLLAYKSNKIDMWRACDFVRPKWGIYRSVGDIGNLINKEDTVRFANFKVYRVKW